MENTNSNVGNKDLAKALSFVLADTYALYLKTQNYHWNVTGPKFIQLHNLLEDHYLTLAESVDDIAERIRTLGERAPGTFSQFSELTSLKEETSLTNADDMIADLSKSHMLVASKIREVANMSDSLNDIGTSELLGARLADHEKKNWMLSSLLK